VRRRYKSFEDTPVWQRAHGLVLKIYEISTRFPKEEMYSLTSQIRRAVISVEANIAEAFGRYHYLDKLNFYYNARGSLEESKSHWMTTKDLKYITQDKYEELKIEIEQVEEELNKIIVTLRNKSEKS